MKESKLIIGLVFIFIGLLNAQNANTFLCPKGGDCLATKITILPTSIKYDSIQNKYSDLLKELNEMNIFIAKRKTMKISERKTDVYVSALEKVDSFISRISSQSSQFTKFPSADQAIDVFTNYRNDIDKYNVLLKEINEIESVTKSSLSTIPLIGSFNRKISPEVKFMASNKSVNTSIGIYTGINQNENYNSFALFNPAISDYGISVSGFQSLSTLALKKNVDVKKVSTFLNFLLTKVGFTYNMDLSNKVLNINQDSLLSFNQFLGNLGVEIQFLDFVTVYGSSNFNEIVTNRSEFRSRVSNYELKQKYYNIGADMLLSLGDDVEATSLNLNVNLILLNDQMSDIIGQKDDMLMPIYKVSLRRSL